MPAFNNGDHVEFADFENDTVIHSGVVLNYLPPNDPFKGGYHVACYYVVGEEWLSKVEDRKFEAAQVANDGSVRLGDGTVKSGTQLYSRRFDQANQHWSRLSNNNLMFLQTQQAYANDVLRARGHIFLNDIQDLLGFERTPQGQLVGWLRDGDGAGFVDFGISEVEEEPGVFILNLNPDGVIYDKI